MTLPSRVIYLPPGVSPTAPPTAVAPAANPNIPFDRNFFEHVLPQSISHFCKQVDCGGLPVVELLTVDGTTHYINGISGVSDSWVALHTAHLDHDHPIQVFIPYGTIFRVAIHPGEDHTRRRLGFLVEHHHAIADEQRKRAAAKQVPEQASADEEDGAVDEKAERAPASRRKRRGG